MRPQASISIDFWWWLVIKTESDLTVTCQDNEEHRLQSQIDWDLGLFECLLCWVSVFIGSLGLQGREIVRGGFSAERGTREVPPLQRIHAAFGERGDSPPGETRKWLQLTAGTGEPGATLTFTFIAPCPRPVSNHIFLLTNFSLFSLVSVSLPLVTALLFLSIWMPFFPQWYSPGVLYSNSHREKVWFRCTAPSNAEGLWIRARSCTSQLWTARWV